MTKVYSRCGEIFNEEDPNEYEVGETYYSGDKVAIKPSSLLWTSLEGLVETMEEQLYDRVGEVAENGISYPKEASDLYEKLIQNFVDEHLKVECYAVENIKEHIAEYK